MLDNNAIEYISERAFGGLGQLRKLTLSGNRLTTFYDDILEDTRHLSILDLKNNLLPFVSYETVRQIVDNDKAVSAVVYMDGNPFKCNCRLSWIYHLLNETKSREMREALEKVTCVENERHPNDHTNEDLESSNILSEDNYEYYDKNEEYLDRDKPKLNKAKKLTEIPLELLPCPKELMQSVEESYGQPIQNEIRLKSSSETLKTVPTFAFVLSLFLIMV
ncbi:unnamed protein product, partial [Iphiclides podalirius]